MSHSASIRYLRDYIAIPSVNPMGRTDIPQALVGEQRYAEHLLHQLKQMGLDAICVGDKQRPSVVAHASVPGAKETILIASHLDTVPVDNMQIDPFDPQMDSGRIYGRGACDTKAGMAALVAALEPLLKNGTLRCNLVLVGESDEELASIGVTDVLAHLGKQKPDWAIATEPTGLQVITQHKGVALATLRARGRSAHSSRPQEGENAIIALAHAAIALQELGAQLASRPHPDLGPGTCSIGSIHGGHAANIVPNEAHLSMDRRLLPGEDEISFRAELEMTLYENNIAGVEVTECRVEKPALHTAHDHPCVQRCLYELTEANLPNEPGAAAFGTDGGVLAQHGIPSVVWGPGSIAQAHTEREFVDQDQVEAMTSLFAGLLSR